MTVKELKDMAIDTKIIVRDRADGHFIKDASEYNDKEICNIYARAHRCGNPGKMRGEIIVFVR